MTESTQTPPAESEPTDSQPTGSQATGSQATDSLPTEQPGADTSGETIGASAPGAANTAEKDPSQWVTGDEPMTGAQRSYLDTLAREAGETLPAEQTKAEASENIDRLQHETGRGASS